MANTTPPDGVFVPVPTFFKESADSSSLQPAIDVPQQVAHSVHLAKSGITGLVLMGSTGEAIHMSRQERVDMISGVRKGLDEAGYKDYPIMAGVLVNSVDETLEWLDDSAKAGAQWGLVLAPGYFGGAASQDNLVEWYTLVADKSPLPILIYNYPGVTNNLVVSIDTYAKLAAHPKIVGCKMSHGNVSHHVQVSLHPKIDHSKFRVYSGFGQQLGPIVVFNAAGGLDEAGYKDYPIMAGVLVNSVDETLEWLDDSAKAGAQWGLVLAPGYFGGAASQDNLVEWYTLVADKSPLPILIYNYPGVTNNLVVSIDTYAKLAAHPKIVGCKMSHGNVSHHVQVSLHPKIDHSKFRVYSGFGQQLGPIVVFNAAGVIDGLAAIYPKTITRLFKLASQRPADEKTQEEVRRLQWKVSSAEEFIVKNGILGIREAIFKVLGFGHLKGGRLPLKGTLAQGVWEEWSDILGQMADEEKSL
ncbi:hypothetical protein BN1708_002769, partial [Verticillium longisporum]